MASVFADLASAARRTYENPQAKSVVFACRKFEVLNERRNCLRRKIEEIGFSPADTRLLWEKLIEMVAKKPLIAKISFPESRLNSQGAALVIESIQDLREFEKYLGYNPPHMQSVDAMAKPGSNNYLIGRSHHISKQDFKRSMVFDVRLGPNRTLPDLIREAVSIGLERAGYKIVNSESGDNAEVARIKIEISRFWLWNRYRSTGIHGYGDTDFLGEFEIEITDVASPNSKLVHVQGKTRLRGSSPRESRSWKNIGTETVASLIQEIEDFAVSSDARFPVNREGHTDGE